MKKRISLIAIACTMGSSLATAQQLVTKEPLLDKAFTLAVSTLYDNTPDSLIKAGGKYGGEWTRDVSINAWNAASLLMPEKTQYSLWSVTTNQRSLIGHQYWDQIIWVTGAWHHYQATNDYAFLQQAYIASANTMRKLEQEVYDAKYGLFTGPSVFNDGIAGYEEPIFQPNIKSSYVLHHPGSKNIKCLSTNCIYYEGYQTLAKMAEACGKPNEAKEYRKKAKEQREHIRTHLYDAKKHQLYYLIDGDGTIHPHQEGLGIAFAILFGVVTPKEAQSVIDRTYTGKYGLPSIYPTFHRFSKEHPGRHNQMVWPFVNAFWAEACLQNNRKEIFMNEFRNLAVLAVEKGKDCFWEIYNEETGEVDGGWQVGRHWDSVHHQTWSATGYLRMVFGGLLGMTFSEKGMSLHPEFELLKSCGFEEISGIRFQKGSIRVKMSGNGKKLSSVWVDSKKWPASKDVLINHQINHEVTIEYQFN